MEYAEGGDLSSYLTQQKLLNEDITRKIFQQIIDGIYYLHQIGVCHRNLKLENIFFSSKKRDSIKIINFGHSNLYLTGVSSDNPTLSFGAEFLETPYGSLEYTPPEMILGCKYDGLLLDIWSCGIILYTMLFGCFPFEENNLDKLYTKIIKGEFIYPKNINISEEAKMLITKILVVNPRLRSDINDIRRDIWFMKNYEQIHGLYISIRDIPISDLVIQKMDKYGFQKNEIIKDIKNNRHNNITTIYYLLVNKLRKEGIETISDLFSNEFKEYLKEQDLKNNLIKKGEKPISLKIMKSDSKPLFDLNESSTNNHNPKFDLDYLKNLFQAYEPEEKTKEIKKDVNKINIIKKNNKKDNQKSLKNNKNTSTKEKRSKSQNTKKINDKNKMIYKDRYSYSTSLNKRNNKKRKDDKMKLVYKNKILLEEKEENKNNSKIKQITNIKEIIKAKNKSILNNNFKNSILTTSTIKPIRNHLVINSTSFSRNKINSKIINNNIFSNNNDSNIKLNKIRKYKEKNIKNINVKNLSLKSKYFNDSIYSHLITSRNNLDNGLSQENKTTGNYKRKYKLNSASNSKSKSVKSKSNYSSGKGETIFCQNDLQSKTKKKYANIKISVIKPCLLNEDNNFSKEKILKKINKSIKTEPISTSDSKKKHIKNINIQNETKSPNKSNKKKNDKYSQLKEIFIEKHNSNSPKSNYYDNKNIKKNSKNKNIKNNKERTSTNILNASNVIKINSKRGKDLDDDIKKNIKFDSSNNKNNTKIFSNLSKKLIPNKTEISSVKKYSKSKKNFKNYNMENLNNKKNNEDSKFLEKNQMIQKTYKNLNLQDKKQKKNRITNIKSINLNNEKEKKIENSNKIKINEIKSIRMSNIPKGYTEFKTNKNSEKKINKNHLKTSNIKEEKINSKNRKVINLK